MELLHEVLGETRLDGELADHICVEFEGRVAGPASDGGSDEQLLVVFLLVVAQRKNLILNFV